MGCYSDAGLGDCSCQCLGNRPTQVIKFIDRHGRLIGDVGVLGNLDDLEQIYNDVEILGVDPVIVNDDIKIAGVDGAEGPEDPAPQDAIEEIEIDDLEIQEPDPAPIEVETVPDETVKQAAPTTEPAQLPELRCSTRVKTNTLGYILGMSGLRYRYTVTQLFFI